MNRFSYWSMTFFLLAAMIAGCGEVSLIPNIPSNGLAKTPPMGWNSWYSFGGTINEDTVRSIADAIVSSGMRDAGYSYINIDDTWEGTRDAQGNIHPNQRFPDMKGLADYIHSKGLKFGIYSSPGPETCAGFVGSYGHEEQDAITYAAWGVDYLKYDWCSAKDVYSGRASPAAYAKMATALQSTGRPIIYSLCNYGEDYVTAWGSKVGSNLWRTTSDIQDSWEKMISNIEAQASDANSAGPGHWNDPDMLQVGRGGMTQAEYRTHMSLWAMASAPLLAGNDIRVMSSETSSILLNSEVIAVDQDRLGTQATRIRNGDIERWLKPLADGSVAVAYVNLGSTPAQVEVSIQDLHLANAVTTARDLWAHTSLPLGGDGFSRLVPSHDVLMLKLGPS